jgi:hypothetical protein
MQMIRFHNDPPASNDSFVTNVGGQFRRGAFQRGFDGLTMVDWLRQASRIFGALQTGFPATKSYL